MKNFAFKENNLRQQILGIQNSQQKQFVEIKEKKIPAELIEIKRNDTKEKK